MRMHLAAAFKSSSVILLDDDKDDDVFIASSFLAAAEVCPELQCIQRTLHSGHFQGAAILSQIITVLYLNE